MPTFSRIRRKRGPALTWAPTQDSYYELAQILRGEGRLPLYVTQAAILEFEAHLRESSLPLPFGLLAGDFCICPDTKLEYVLIDTVARARIELGQDDPYAQLAEELQSLASEQTRQRKLAIGWYLGGLANDLTLDDDVARLHGQLFPERWQVALVRGADSGAERGAFLRYESIWSRWYSIPFFEFLTERAGHKKGEVRTAIRWENYRSDEPARPLDEFESSVRRANAAPRPSWGARLFGTSLEPLRRAGRGTPRRTTEPTQATSTAARWDLSSGSPAPPQTMASPIAPRPTVVVPPSRAEPLEIKSPPRRAPDPPRVEPAERKVAARVDQTAAAPVAPKLPGPVASNVPASVPEERTAPVAQSMAAPVAPSVALPVEPAHAPPVEQRPAASVVQGRAVPVQEIVTPAPELRVAPTPELKVASTAELKVAPPAEVNVAVPAEARIAATAEVQHVFIDGTLVPAPLAYDFPQKPGMLPGPDRVKISSFVVGALLLLMLVLLYLIAS